MIPRNIQSVPKADSGLCRALEGKEWNIGDTIVDFNKIEKRGKDFIRPYPAGIEAYAYRVTDQQTGSLNFIKLYKTELKSKRLRRLQWLINQRLWSWDECFRGAPRGWVSTQQHGRPDGIDRDFGGVRLTAVPGSIWQDWKTRLETQQTEWSDHVRISLAKQLVRALAMLEQSGLTHGDISEGNVLVHNDGVSGPKLYIIDFDGFVYRPQETCGMPRRWSIQLLRQLIGQSTLFSTEIPTLDADDCKLTVQEGGTIGTRNYAPPELLKEFDERRHHNLSPVSDTHARDVFLVELLCWGLDECGDESPLEWDTAQKKAAANIIRATAAPLQYLLNGDVLDLATKRRPNSVELASQWSITLPPPQLSKGVSPAIFYQPWADSAAPETPVSTVQRAVAYLAVVIVMVVGYNLVFSNRSDTSVVSKPKSEPDLQETRGEILDPQHTERKIRGKTQSSSADTRVPDTIASTNRSANSSPTNSIDVPDRRNANSSSPKSAFDLYRDQWAADRASPSPDATSSRGTKRHSNLKLDPAYIGVSGIEFVRINPGSYLMGTAKKPAPLILDERQYKVTLTQPFYAARYEVTIGQALVWLNDVQKTSYDKFSPWIDMDDPSCPILKVDRGFVRNTNSAFGQSDEQPMVLITLTGTKAFCSWCSSRDKQFDYRIPTEAEWEYMARAGSTAAFPWGEHFDASRANVGSKGQNSSRGHTKRVGSYEPNAWGLYDVVGNVEEWVSDVYGPYSDGASVNPMGSSSGSQWVVRGGSWLHPPNYARSASRTPMISPQFQLDLGFRVICEPKR